MQSNTPIQPNPVTDFQGLVDAITRPLNPDNPYDALPILEIDRNYYVVLAVSEMQKFLKLVNAALQVQTLGGTIGPWVSDPTKIDPTPHSQVEY